MRSNARHWKNRPRVQAYTDPIHTNTFQGVIPFASAAPMSVAMTALPTIAIGMLRYWVRTFSFSTSRSRTASRSATRGSAGALGKSSNGPSVAMEAA